MKPCYALRHVPFESLGLLEPLIRARGYELHMVDVPITSLAELPLADAELVVVLGGPISAYEEHLYPFLRDELVVLEQRLSRQRSTIGICLGAQLMARALGARVYPGRQKEIGWSPLTLANTAENNPLRAVDGQAVLHWHGDTYDLPDGAKLLASTDVTPHQAFVWQQHAMALQFHLEVTAPALESWYVGHTLELSQLKHTTIPELRAAGKRQAPILAPYAERALATILDDIATE